MKEKLLFCIQSMEMGGPQKSLLALLYELDYSRFDVDLMIWSQKGRLIKYLPKQVNIIQIPDELAYLRISLDAIKSKSVSLIKNGKGDIVLNVLKYVIRGHQNMNIARQRFWKKYKNKFSKLEGDYDIAIAVSGGNLCYFVVDCVTAKRKLTWVRTDYRVLKRDKQIDEDYFKKVDGVITVSYQCKDILLREFPSLNFQKVSVMYNLLPFKLYDQITTNTSIISRKHNEKILLTVSRIDPNKGLDIALDAMKYLKDEGFNIKWYVLGDGIYRKALQKMIDKNGLNENFILLGFQDNPYAFIKECDVFVHPSRFEGKSNAVDEAKYALKPIVLTNYPTAAEQITHMQNGYVTNLDGMSLGRGIQEVLINPDLASNFVFNLKNSRQSSASKIHNFYEVLAGIN
ncbi:MAG: glycosyltransferase [Youngiibacter sp.]|nr:glycosyltransferase [Youngiibacter sp.]